MDTDMGMDVEGLRAVMVTVKNMVARMLEAMSTAGKEERGVMAGSTGTEDTEKPATSVKT